MKRIIMVLLVSVFTVFNFACETENPTTDNSIENHPQYSAPETYSHEGITVTKGDYYFTAPKVSLYLHAFETLPSNYMTKDEAEDLGWVSHELNLRQVTETGMIGGDRFFNREGRLPSDYERMYFEADVDYDFEDGYGNRGKNRLVYSNDGLIYHTTDHYDSFELLFGEE